MKNKWEILTQNIGFAKSRQTKISDLTIDISGLEMILHKRSEANKEQKVVIHVTWQSDKAELWSVPDTRQGKCE